MKNGIRLVLVVLFVVGFAVSTSGIADAKKGGNGKGSQKSHEVKHKDEHKHKDKDKHGDKTVSADSKTKPSTPPGWSRGRKVGWRGKSYPPGWSKWNETKRTTWMSERDEAVRIIDNDLYQYHFTSNQSYQVIGAFDQAVAGGMAIDSARRKLVDAIKDGDARKNLMIDGAQATLDLLR